jgi:hypothetical protein
MPLFLANVQLTDTFNTWRLRTNSIIGEAASATGNTVFTGANVTFSSGTSLNVNGTVGKLSGARFTLPTTDGSVGQAMVTNGSGQLSFAAAGATITDDTTTNATNYIVLSAATSGSLTTAKVSSTKLLFNPGTGVLTANSFSGAGGTLTGLDAGNIAAGTLAVARGGTGLSSYTTGDIVYASGSTTLASLAGVATGNALISGGVGTASSYGKIGLTTHVDGTLPIGNGGTGLASTPTNGQLLIGNGSGYSVAALTQGAGMTITNGSGTVTVTNAGVLAVNGQTGNVTITAGSTVVDDTTTNSDNFYLVMANNQTSGSLTTAIVSSTKIYFNPSTGQLSATNLNSLSDQRLKTNIEVIANGLDIVNQLEGVEFNWIDNGNKSSGVIAQQIEEFVPHLVSNSRDSKGVNYNGLIGYLIEAIKELNQKVKTLEAKLDK